MVDPIAGPVSHSDDLKDRQAVGSCCLEFPAEFDARAADVLGVL